MRDVYERKLNYTEAKRHFIYVQSAAWELFPPSGEPFTLRVGGRKFEVQLDKEDRIWSNDFRDYIDLARNNVVVLKKDKDGSFVLSLKG
jgi:hypothetical protein